MSFEVKLMIVTAMGVLVGNIARDWKGRSSVFWGIITVCVGALYTPLVFSMLLVIAFASKVKSVEQVVPADDDGAGAPRA